MNVFKSYPTISVIFEDFSFMDEREKALRMKRDSYFEIFKLLNDKGFIEDAKRDKIGEKRLSDQSEIKPVKQEMKGTRKNFKNSGDVYYKKKEWLIIEV